MTITGTTVEEPLEIGFIYGVTITGLTAGHTTALQYEDSNGFHTIDDTEVSGIEGHVDHVILVTSRRINILVSAGTGDLEVNFTRKRNR